MSMVTDVTKKIILAGLGTIDEQNDEIKDLLKRGSEVLGLGAVDNEELLYNGNREEIMRKRKERENAENSLELGHGRSLHYNSVKDDDGKVVERNLEFEKKPEYGSKAFSFEAGKDEDGTKSFAINTSNRIEGANLKAIEESKGGAEDDQN